ncbi:Putative uncharacterized protein C21orf32 [Triticum urartu]|uniref:Uncharacterized protein n=1 Tax=Triticum urartu TaxID=4572 RepID=M7ZXG0_TRIUA|nr:Putative uncharacterized protein C21orf32 [Triticum urartu]
MGREFVEVSLEHENREENRIAHELAQLARFSVGEGKGLEGLACVNAGRVVTKPTSQTKLMRRGIDYALSGGDIPKIAGEIPDTLRKVYELRKDPFLQSSVMVLIISCKNACKNKWFQPSDFIDILRMADEVFLGGGMAISSYLVIIYLGMKLSGSFCTNSSEPANDSTVLEIISTVMPRYYPKLKFDRLITSLEAKVGYDILMADFFIHRNLPKHEKICLVVVQKENLDVSSCIASPQHVSFLVNGKGVDKRTNVSMETGPQFPTDITKMLKYGANIVQAVGYFTANYIIAVAVVNNLMSFDAPKLSDYAQPVTTDLPDSDSDMLLEGPSRVSLKCPISFRRVQTPVKGRLCKHHQILQETGNDIMDVLVFPDGSWKAVSVHDEKSDKHGDAIQQNGNTVETDATPSDVIDLINKDDDGDLPMSSASSSEDLKPVLNSQDISVMDYLPDFPLSTAAQSEDMYVGGGTSTSGQNSLPSSSGGPGTSSIGTLESILPRDILQMLPATTRAISPSETSNLTSAMQQVSQGYPNIMQMQSQLDSLLRSAHHTRNVRREPVAVQALAVPQHNSSRRVQANVSNCPPPTPQSISPSSNYQAHHVTNADSVITSMVNGVGPLSRAPDGSSPFHLQSTQQDMRNMPNHQRGRVMGLAANPYMHMRPPTGGPGQGRGANAYGGPYPQQYQQYDQRQFDNLIGQLVNRGGPVSQATPGHLYVPQQSQAMRTQALSRPSTPPVQPRVQSPGLAPTAPRVQSPGLAPTVPRVQSPGLAPTAPRVQSPGLAPTAPRVQSPGLAPTAPRVQSPGLAPTAPRVQSPGLAPTAPRVQSPGLAPTAPRVQSPGLAPTVPRVQSPGLPPSPTPATPLLEDSDVPEIEMDPNWQPTGQMRGSLSPGLAPTAPRVQSPGLAPTVPRVQSPGLPPSPTPATPLLEDSDVPEIEMDPNWQPTGQMRGSLVGSAYDQAIERYLQPGGGQRTNQSRPPGRSRPFHVV